MPDQSSPRARVSAGSMLPMVSSVRIPASGVHVGRRTVEQSRDGISAELAPKVPADAAGNNRIRGPIAGPRQPASRREQLAGILGLVGEDGPESRRVRGTDQIRAKLHCKGLGGAGRRAPTPNSRRPDRPRRPPRGTLVARTAGVERESDSRRVPRPGLYPVRRVRCSCGRPAPRAREPRGCARRSRSRCARPAARSTGLSMECCFGVFPDRYGPRNQSCSVVPNCSARTCVSFLTEPRRSPAAPVSRAPEAGSGAPKGLS